MPPWLVLRGNTYFSTNLPRLEIEAFLGNTFGITWEWVNFEAQIEAKESRCFNFGMEATLCPVGNQRWHLVVNSRVAFGSLKDKRITVDITSYLKKIIIIGGMIPFVDQKFEEDEQSICSISGKCEFSFSQSMVELCKMLEEINFGVFRPSSSTSGKFDEPRIANFWGSELQLRQLTAHRFELLLISKEDIGLNIINISNYFDSILRKYFPNEITLGS